MIRIGRRLIVIVPPSTTRRSLSNHSRQRRSLMTATSAPSVPRTIGYETPSRGGRRIHLAAHVIVVIDPAARLRAHRVDARVLTRHAPSADALGAAGNLGDAASRVVVRRDCGNALGRRGNKQLVVRNLNAVAGSAGEMKDTVVG